MADQILDQVRDALEMTIDYKGQKLAEQLSTWLLVLVGMVALAAGWSLQNIHHTLWLGLGGTAVVFLVVVPPWPMYKRNAVRWLPPRTAPAVGNIQIQIDGRNIQ